MFKDVAIIHQESFYNLTKLTGIIGCNFYQVRTSPFVPRNSIMINCSYAESVCMKVIETEG